MEVFTHNFCNINSDSQLPPGFKFHPTDEELISCYLIHKVLDATFTCRAIADVDLNKCEPWELPQRAKMEGKEWYFFSLRDRKYPTGLRTNRATEAGYWKATGKDREVYSSKSSCLVGMKKTLVFYRGRAPKGEKSNWVMHEYRLDGKLGYQLVSNSSKDEWVICRVFQKPKSTNNTRCATSGTTKHQTTAMNTNMNMNSSTLISIPPALEPSYITDHDTYSYDSNNTVSKPHVPCFSNSSFNNFSSQSFLDVPNPMYCPGNVEVSAFPSLRTLQENLQLPFFYSLQPQAAVVGEGGMCGDGNLFGGNWSPAVSLEMEDQKPGPTELDCIWSF